MVIPLIEMILGQASVGIPEFILRPDPDGSGASPAVPEAKAQVATVAHAKGPVDGGPPLIHEKEILQAVAVYISTADSLIRPAHFWSRRTQLAVLGGCSQATATTKCGHDGNLAAVAAFEVAGKLLARPLCDDVRCTIAVEVGGEDAIEVIAWRERLSLAQHPMRARLQPDCSTQARPGGELVVECSEAAQAGKGRRTFVVDRQINLTVAVDICRDNPPLRHI